VRTGLDLVKAAGELSPAWTVSVGIHVGPVVAGIAGNRPYQFDLWGDTVNTAARVESHGRPGSVNVSAAAWQQIADRCRGESLGVVPVKGKVDLEIFRFKEFLPD
jgi:class 3 adenylate cyclase